jgi:hypothetical protein
MDFLIYISTSTDANFGLNSFQGDNVLENPSSTLDINSNVPNFLYIIKGNKTV